MTENKFEKIQEGLTDVHLLDDLDRPRSPSLYDVLERLQEMQATIDKMENQLYDLWAAGQ